MFASMNERSGHRCRGAPRRGPRFAERPATSGSSWSARFFRTVGYLRGRSRVSVAKIDAIDDCVAVDIGSRTNILTEPEQEPP